MPARAQQSGDATDPATASQPETSDTEGPTVALVHTHIDGAFHSGVEGAPDPITAEAQPIKANLVDKVKTAAKSADVAITVKGN